MPSTTVSRLHVGRVVHFFAGYGNLDGRGAIVRVHGTPSEPQETPFGHGLVRVIRAGDCRVDVILFDGRELRAIEQCSIDRPGIGIKLLDDTLPDVSHLPALAAERTAREAIERANDRAAREAREAARKIERAPLFFWNGIKDTKGAKLQRCRYSDGSLLNHPVGTLTIYARDYGHFSQLVCECFAVQNDSDSQVDYFEQDRIRVIPAHPLYAAVRAALDAQKAHAAQRECKRAARRAAR